MKLLSRVPLCDPMDCSLPGSSVHGNFQAIVLEWIAISFKSLKYRLNLEFLVTIIPATRGKSYLWQIHFDIWQN